MTKNKNRASRDDIASTPRRLQAGLREVTTLMARKRWTEARNHLEALDQRFPGQPEVLTPLANVYADLKDTRGRLYACERLLKVDPDNPEAWLGLASVYLDNAWPALTLRAFRHFLRRWPGHPQAAEARRIVAKLEGGLDGWLADLGLAGETGLLFAAQHEEVQVRLSQGQYALARQTAEELLKQNPTFAPALNNISQAYYADGQLDQAIATAQRVLAFEPDNVHTLSNLVSYHCLKGQLAEARQWVARLKASAAPAAERALKVADALSSLGEDQAVLEVLRQVEQSREALTTGAMANLYHLAAVAALRVGQESAARRYWQTALKLRPGYDLAQANLDNLNQPAHERHAPWPYALSHWLLQSTVVELRQWVDSATKSQEPKTATRQAVRQFLQQHPELEALAPVLLDRGDPAGVDFVFNLVQMAETPEWLALLKDFALGQRGPDQKRLKAAQFVAQHGLFAPAHARLWLEGEWRELLLLGFEIHGEAVASPQAPRIAQLLQAAVSALQASQPEKGERLLKRALAQAPDAPEILNNLASAYGQQGRTAEAEALIQQIFERHPDYLFARINFANLTARRGKLEEAKRLLEPIYTRRRMHFSELAALCGANIEIALAEKNLEAARSWVRLWASADPQNPNLAYYRSRVG